MTIFKRLVYEFWIGFVAALGWAFFRAGPIQFEWSWLGTLLANFGAAFFFVSYFTGQFIRISRQQGVENSFRTVIANQEQNTAVVLLLNQKFDDYVAKGLPLPPDFAKEVAQANTQVAVGNTNIANALGVVVGGQLFQPILPPRKTEATSGSG